MNTNVHKNPNQAQKLIIPHLQREVNEGLNILFDLHGVFFGSKISSSYGSSIRPMNIGISTTLLQDCRARGHRLFAVSNWSSDTIDFLKADPHSASLFEYFDDIICADMVGIKKPDPRVFDYLFYKHELDPRSCIFIDDQASNLDGARNAGIDKVILCTNFDLVSVRSKLEQHGVL